MWDKNINKGIFDTMDAALQYELKDKVTKIDYLEIYMNTKYRDRSNEISDATDKALERIKEYNPYLIITSDDDALKFVAKRLLNTKYKIAFCGVNGDPVEIGIARTMEKPGYNVTGVIERQPVLQNLKLIRDVLGRPTDVIIFFDASHASEHMMDYARKQLMGQEGQKLLKDTGMRVREIFTSNSFEDWKKKIRRHQKEKKLAFFFFSYDTLKSNGRSLTLFEVMNWVNDNSRIPDFGLHIDSGGIAGYGNCGYGQGVAVAKKALQILHGNDPGEIPIELPNAYYLNIKTKRAEQLGVEIPFRLLTIAELFK